jgi:CubicO group peptidase (beta-lactamase class C family)
MCPSRFPSNEVADMRFARPFIALALFFFASFLQAQQSPTKKDELPQPKTLEELQSAMKSVLEGQKVPGAGIALVSNGSVLWCGGIGTADKAVNRDVSCDTEFRVGSISKTFVALALLKLEEQGRINLQANLKDIAPEVPLRNRWESTNPVRIVNLLEHTAGFDDMMFREVYNTADSPKMPILEVLQRFTKPQNVRWPPSTRMSYANPGYGAAGFLVEKASGEPWTTYLRQEILTPLGITVGDFDLTDSNRALLSQGHQAHSGQIPTPVKYKEIYLRPAGDMKASPGELAKLVQFFLRRGVAGDKPLLKPETIARMEYPQTPLSARNGLRLGYGLANYADVEGGVVTHGHDGGIDGFISTYRYMPEQNWGYVVLLNSDSSGKALGDLNKLATSFLSRDIPKPQQPSISLSQDDLQKYAGFYQPGAPRSQLFSFMDEVAGGIRVRVANGQLTRSGIFGPPKLLVAVGKNLFRSEKDPEATLTFFSDGGGKMCFTSLGDDGTPYAERVSPVWPYLRICVIALAVILLASSVLYAVVWILLWLFRRLKNVRHLSVRVVPFFAVLALAASIFGAVKSLDDLGQFGVWSVLFFAGTILFALLSLYGLWLAVRVPRSEIHTAVRIHSLLVSLAGCALVIFLASWHLVALRLWAS